MKTAMLARASQARSVWGSSEASSMVRLNKVVL